MNRLLGRLERTFGRFAIENLTWTIVGGMVVVFLLQFVQPSFQSLLLLNIPAVLHGQVWRLVTFLFLPPSDSLLWFFFAISITWLVGTSLEAEWGAFKYNVYYAIGALGTIIAALATGASISNLYLNETLFLAFATLFPRYEFNLFFVLPVQVRWLALLTVAGLGFQFASGGWGARAGIIAGVANYLLFFSGTLVGMVRDHERQARSRARREELRGGASDVGEVAIGQRVCAICGAREVDGADIRVCSCATCMATGAARTLCLKDARAH